MADLPPIAIFIGEMAGVQFLKRPYIPVPSSNNAPMQLISMYELKSLESTSFSMQPVFWKPHFNRFRPYLKYHEHMADHCIYIIYIYIYNNKI